MKSILSLIAVAFVTVGISNAEPVNKDCPVMGDKAAKSDKTAEYSKKISFCCADCKAKFDKEPNKMISKIASYKPEDGKCIVSGKKAATDQSSDYKVTVGMCCNKCLAKFEAAPDKYITKAVK